MAHYHNCSHCSATVGEFSGVTLTEETCPYCRVKNDGLVDGEWVLCAKCREAAEQTRPQAEEVIRKIAEEAAKAAELVRDLNEQGN